MNNQKDEVKALKIEQENRFINIDFVEKLAIKITDDLVEWTNTNIFKPLGGKLSLNIPTWGEPNARAVTYWKKPYHPVIEIRLSMFQEIYRDAFTFPLISKRIATETDNIEHLHKTFAGSYDERFMFSSGMPAIPIESIGGNLKYHFLAFLKALNEKSDENMNENDVACRFVMFELVVAWIFFHELGHLVQRHYLFKNNYQNAMEVEILEIDESVEKPDVDILGQSREIMADIEGTDLTLRYMKRKKILQPQSIYLFLCGVNCMYQRFYQRHETNLDLSRGAHPHPVIRNEFFHHYLLQWMAAFLNDNQSPVALSLIYLSVRSSLMSGLFWAHRIESFDGKGLPTYMDLSSENYDAQKKKYLSTITDEIMNTISIVKNTHMIPLNCIRLFEKTLTSQINLIE